MFAIFKPTILIFLFSVSYVICRRNLYEGEICEKNSYDGISSICRKTQDCPSALRNLERGKYPRICGFDGKVPIVCCRQNEGETKVTTSKPKNAAFSRSSDYPEDEDSIIFLDNYRQKRRSEYVCERYQKMFCKRKDETYTYRTLIVGGTKARGREYPHMALVGFGPKESIKWLCGGSLISESYVLTAAHCTSTATLGKASWVRLGELDVDSNKDDADPKDYEIAQIIIHPEYREPSLYNDIALFKLDREVRFNNHIRPTCLLADSVEERSIGRATATGWGQTGVADPVSSSLMSVEIFITANETCKDNYGTDRKYERGIDSKSMICAGVSDGGKDTCQGDSGGPLQVKISSCKNLYNQIGITSFGRGCAEPDSPGVYTRMSHYVPWIESVVWK